MRILDKDDAVIAIEFTRLEAQHIQYALLRWLQMCGHPAICPAIPNEDAITTIVNSGMLMGEYR